AAWAVLPLPINPELPWGGRFATWRLYVILESLPSLVTGLFLLTLDETPRFQLSKGREEEAIITLSKLYTHNTGIPMHEYPVKALKTDGVMRPMNRVRKGPCSGLLTVWDQIYPLLKPPHLPVLILCCFLQAACFIANGLLIWLPDIFGRTASSELSDSPICEALELSPLPDLLHQDDESQGCDSSSVDTIAFFNALVIGGTVGIAYIIVAFLSGHVNKRVLFGCTMLSASAMGFGTAPSSPSSVTLAITSLFHAFSGVSITLLGGIVTDLFPTHLRAASMSLSLTFGRFGMVGGGSVIGTLLESSCESAFHTTGAVALAVALLSLLIPKGQQTSLR
ncbi:hypothetical protein J437_LFUL012460, partial [Ladona fulva]